MSNEPVATILINAPGIDRARLSLHQLISTIEGVIISEPQSIDLQVGGNTIAKVLINDKTAWSTFVRELASGK